MRHTPADIPNAVMGSEMRDLDAENPGATGIIGCPATRSNSEEMPYYQRHIFFCINEREHRICCQDHGASELRDYAKARVKALGLAGQGKIRVNTAGCLDRCSEGPVAVVYPDGVWYSYETRADIDEIIEEHLVHGRVVERLRI